MLCIQRVYAIVGQSQHEDVPSTLFTTNKNNCLATSPPIPVLNPTPYPLVMLVVDCERLSAALFTLSLTPSTALFILLLNPLNKSVIEPPCVRGDYTCNVMAVHVMCVLM